jgi:RNA polymerase sigma factor (sigma-70 family)
MLSIGARHNKPEWDADQAVTVLYGAHHRALAQMAMLLVNDVVVAEEIVEAAFVAAHAAWRRLRDCDRALPYLQRAVVRRARSRRAADPGLSRRRLGSPQTGQPDSSSSGALLVTVLYALPARQREALVLRYYAGLPDTQIAFVMGIPRRSASNYLERGTVSLRTALERHSMPATDRPEKPSLLAPL